MIKKEKSIWNKTFYEIYKDKTKSMKQSEKNLFFSFVVTIIVWTFIFFGLNIKGLIAVFRITGIWAWGIYFFVLIAGTGVGADKLNQRQVFQKIVDKKKNY